MAKLSEAAGSAYTTYSLLKLSGAVLFGAKKNNAFSVLCLLAEY